jgi:hypothetical protein
MEESVTDSECYFYPFTDPEITRTRERRQSGINHTNFRGKAVCLETCTYGLGKAL